MKPGSGDKQAKLLITGRELDELKKLTWQMADAFGLDGRIDRYAGKRAIGLWPWDLDCLEAVTASALRDERAYPGRTGAGYEAMRALHDRFVGARTELCAGKADEPQNPGRAATSKGRP